MQRCHNSGWERASQATEGGAIKAEGLALELTAKGTKHYKNDDLD